MTSSSLPSRKILTAFAMGLATLIAPGCGDDTGLGKRYPVSGRVTFKNEPIKQGRINFIPAKAGEGRAAQSEIVDGSYSLTTATEKDGALPGSYKVTISSVSIDPAAQAKLKEFSQGGQSRLGPESAKIMKGAVANALPSKYSLPETSGLTAEVPEQSITQNFDLKE